MYNLSAEKGEMRQTGALFQLRKSTDDMYIPRTRARPEATTSWRTPEAYE